MHVVVTGASSGIGEGLVLEYARRKATKITMLARSKDKMEAIAKAIPEAQVHIIPWDLSSVERCLGWIEEAEERHGPIDILINNAGVQIVAPLVGSDPDAGERLLALDLTVPLQLMRAILPKMLERDAGAIVNIASLAAIAPTPGMFYYSAAKAGLGAASELLRGELRDSQVRVLTVYPGPVDTPMARAAYETYDGAAPRILQYFTEGTTDELAVRIRRALDADKARLIYPRFYTLARHFPGLTQWILTHFAPIPPMPKQESEKKA